LNRNSHHRSESKRTLVCWKPDIVRGLRGLHAISDLLEELGERRADTA